MSENTKTTTYMIRGKAKWVKILGNPVPNFDRSGNEWTMEVFPDEEGLSTIEAAGISDRLKDKGEGKFISFRQREKNRDGEPHKKIRVVDAQGRSWDAGTLIGNDSEVDVKFRVRDYGKGKKAGVYPQAVRVLSLVKYEGSGDFAPLSEDDKFFKVEKDEFKRDFGLEDDDLPEELA